MLPSTSELNRLDREGFAQALKPLFEAAEPLAEALYARRPYASYEELIDRAEHLTLTMPFDDQAKTLGAHPRIGANESTLSAASRAEQAGEEPPSVLEALAWHNDEYERRFGFRFVVFVNRRPKSEILSVLEVRLRNSRELELRTGLSEMFRIARDRLCLLNG